PSDKRDISDDRCAVLCLLHIFAHQSAEHDSRTIIDADACSNLASTEDRLVDYILSKKNLRVQCVGEDARIYPEDWTSVVIDAFLLVERANDDLKLWVRHNAGKTENSRRNRWSTSAKKQCVDRIRANSKVTAAVATGYGKLVRRRKGEVCWVGCRRGSPGANN